MCFEESYGPGNISSHVCRVAKQKQYLPNPGERLPYPSRELAEVCKRMRGRCSTIYRRFHRLPRQSAHHQPSHQHADRIPVAEPNASRLYKALYGAE